jgi:thiamine pyrophosphate-dependent acetolactate synthase large subunit-like protein
MTPTNVHAGAGNTPDVTLDQRLARLSPAQRALFDQRLQDEPASGHSLVARTLAALGVTHVYGVPGQPVYDTFGACGRENIRVISAHHQHPAAAMATAHNYFAGQQQAASIVSSGVPAANTLSAVAAARDNCWPLVVLAGAVPHTASDAGYFMALDATELYRPVAKWTARVPDTHAIPAFIAEGFQRARNGRPGPVLVELPESVLTGLTVGGSTPPLAGATPDAPEPDPEVLRRVAAVLIGARRPLLIVGKGVRWGAPFAELGELVDALELPFITSPIGRHQATGALGLASKLLDHLGRGLGLGQNLLLGSDFQSQLLLGEVQVAVGGGRGLGGGGLDHVGAEPVENLRKP